MTEPSGWNWGELLNKAKAVSFDPLPNAQYHVLVHSADAVQSSTGKPMIKLTLSVVEGAFQNRKLMDQLVLSPDSETALSIFFRKLKALGIDEAFVVSQPPGHLGPIAAALLGRHALVTVGQREWQGEMRNDVKGYAPYTGVMAGALPPAMGGQPVLPGMMPQPVQPMMYPPSAPHPVVQPIMQPPISQPVQQPVQQPGIPQPPVPPVPPTPQGEAF